MTIAILIITIPSIIIAHFLILKKVKEQNEKRLKIESTAFCQWAGKYGSIRGNNGSWLSYWELYDVWLTHDKKQIYIDHVTRSIQLFKKQKEERQNKKWIIK